jgi:hypothetical protein
MTPEQLAAIQRLLEGGAAPEGPPYDPKKEAATLTADLALYFERRDDFQPGDIVRQRIGLCMQRREYSKLAYAFVQYLPTEGPDGVVVVKFPEYHRLDCVLAQSDVEGDAHFFIADSRRYELYPQADLDAASAEAKKAIN